MRARPTTLLLPFLLAACGSGSGSLTAVNLPLNAAASVNGTIIGVELASQQAGGASFTTSPTEVQTSDRTNPAGLTLTLSAAETAGGTRQVDRPANSVLVDSDIDLTVGGTLNNGAAITDVAGVSGTSFFQRGSFGDPSSDSDARTQIEGVGISGSGTARQIVLNDLSLLRIASFDAGTNEGVYAVGFIGNETALAEIPGAADPATTYAAFLRFGQTLYNSAGTPRDMLIREVGSSAVPEFDIVADWAAGTLTADIQNIELVADDAANPGTTIVLTPVVDSLFMQGNIAGNVVSGTVMQFEDAAGNLVGFQIAQQVNGAFFGTDAAEVGMVGILEGVMDIDDGTGFAPREYILSVVLGGTQ